MVFEVRPDIATPLYLQIKEDLHQEIVAGALAPGTRLPSSRQLAKDLGVSRITVANAYAELEAEGLIEARAGSGTFVLPTWCPASAHEATATIDRVPSWQVRLIDGPDTTRDQMLREALRTPGTDDVVSFAGSRGDARLFPHAEFRKIVDEVLRADGALALDYEFSEGYLPLRQALARYVRQQGISATAEGILITAGAQQAIDLVARALLGRGDRVVVESPTYPGALVAFEARGTEVIGVPLDGEGMRADALQRVLEREQPRLIYTVPTFHNPTGTVMSAVRRREVVTLANRYGVPLLEDDYLREVRFGSPIPPPLAAFDQHGDVVHVGSFSKSLLPALRLGYTVACGPIRERLASFKRASDICCSSLLQRALWRYLESGRIQKYWKRISHIYRQRQRAMAAALRRHFPPGARWTAVEGGFVVWVEVPQRISVAALFEEALRAGISFASGAAFFPEPADQPFMRLNFAALDEKQIERGVSVLGQLLRKQTVGQGGGIKTRLAEPASPFGFDKYPREFYREELDRTAFG